MAKKSIHMTDHMASFLFAWIQGGSQASICGLDRLDSVASLRL